MITFPSFFSRWKQNTLLPLRLVGGMGGLGQLLGGGGEPLLGPLQVLLQQLDPPVQGGDLTLGL